MNRSLSTLSFRSLLITVVLAAPLCAQNLTNLVNGTPANADQVNGNFLAVKTSVQAAQASANAAQATANVAQATADAAAGSVNSLTSLLTISNGKLGIGTTAPDQLLTVNGNAMFGVIDNSGIGLDAQSAPRLGLVKKFGQVPSIASGAGSPIIFSQSSSANVLDNISGSTFIERMRIGADGNVNVPGGNLSVGSPPSQVHRMHIYGTGSSTNNQPHYVAETDGGTFGPQLRLKHGGASGQEWVLLSGGSGNGGVGAGSFGLIRVNAAQPAIVVNADGTCRNAAGSWTTLSDERLKEHVQPIDSTNALQSLLALRGVTFEYTDAAIESHGAPDGQRTGFIAQEVEKVLPQWVSADADGIRKITEHGTTALVVEALRELDTKNRALQGENATLRAQVESLAADMAALKAAMQPLLAK